MQINLLCVGDVVGKPGRLVLSELLPQLVRDEQVDCVVANAENAAQGSGLTPALYEKFLQHGVDVVTMGDHIYKRRELVGVLEQSDRIVRPVNLPNAAVGKELTIFQTRRGPRVAVLSALGQLYMRPAADSPFRAVDRVLERVPRDVHIVVLDFHAEATSEKVAMGWHLDGRVSLVVGTHTHVPTSDETVLPRGTGYITDLGMTGPYESVLGRRKDRVLQHLLTGMPTRFEVADGDARLSGVLARIDSETGKTLEIRRIMLRASLEDQQGQPSGS
jgi:metallophosphoesterase (TIGR00282 family)